MAKRWDWRRYSALYELRILLALGIVPAGVWGFVMLAEMVNAGATETLDRTLLLALRNPLDPAAPLGPVAAR